MTQIIKMKKKKKKAQTKACQGISEHHRQKITKVFKEKKEVI